MLPGWKIWGAALALTLFIWPGEVSADWNTFRYDGLRSGAVPYAVGDLSPLRWTSPDTGVIMTPPAVSPSGNIYIGTQNGLVKIDKTGQKIWTLTGINISNSSPVLDSNQNIYLTSCGGGSTVSSITESETIRWQRGLGSGGACAPPVLSPDQQTVYVGNNYTLLALNAVDGTTKWQIDLAVYSVTNNALVGAAVASDGTIYAATDGNGALFSISPTGTIKWKTYIVSGSPAGTPVIGPDNNLYITGHGDTLISYDLTGKKRWTYPLSNSSFSGETAIKDNIIYAVSHNYSDNTNHLQAIDTSSGTQIWDWPQSPTSSISLTAPVVDKNSMIYTSGADTVYSIGPDGSLKYTFAIADGLRQVIIPEDGVIYIARTQSSAPQGGYLYSLGQIPKPLVNYPVIFIPGIGGSEFKATQDIFWSKPDGHGGTYSHAYGANEKIWVNQTEAAALGDDDYFDVLRLKADGQTPEADLSLTKNLTSFGYPDIDSFFQDLGYQKDTNFFNFTYDWRKDIRTTESDLNDLVAKAKQQSGKSKVNIVAHSMGGLVAHNYIADASNSANVNKLIEMGIPHLGATDGLKALIYGKWLNYNIPFLPFIALGIIPDREIQDLFSGFPSGFELKPNSTYYLLCNNSTPNCPSPFKDERDIDNNGVTGNLNYNQTQVLLRNLQFNPVLLDLADQFSTSLNSFFPEYNGVKTYHIVGSAQPTLGQIRETWWITWPINLFPKTDEVFINGDDTVPLYSASLKNDTLDLSAGAKIYYVEQKHEDLPNRSGIAMQLVKAILNDSDTLPVEVKSDKIVLEGKDLSVDQDAVLDLYDNDGNHTGLNNNGEIETNITDTYYDTIGKTKHVFIKKKSKKVKVKVTSPKKNSKTNLTIHHYSNDSINKTSSYQNVPVTDTAPIEFTIDPTTDTSPTLPIGTELIPPTSEATGSAALDTTPPATTINISGTQNADGSYTGSVTISLVITDNGSGVLRTDYSLDGGRTVQTYTGPFTVIAVGTTTIQFFSTDNLGNQELPQTVTISIIPPPSSAASSTPNNSSSEPSIYLNAALDNKNEQEVITQIFKSPFVRQTEKPEILGEKITLPEILNQETIQPKPETISKPTVWTYLLLPGFLFLPLGAFLLFSSGFLKNNASK